MTMPVRAQGLIQPVRYLRLSLRRKGDQSGREAAGRLKISTRAVLSLRSPSGKHKCVQLHSLK
jgi:hypothetical protein